MIVVAGLTPAWQKILRFEKLRMGEVNRAAEAIWCASGKVLNVGLAAAQLGAPCRTISPAGGLARGEFEQEFADLKIDVEWIPSGEPTRVCTTLLDAATGHVTELVENAKPLSAVELQAYREAYARAATSATTAVFTGSLPAETPTSFYRELVDVTPGRIIADVRGPELLELLDAPRKPFLIKPNREELKATLNRMLIDQSELHRAMRELNKRGAEWVVVTSGAGAVWASSATELWRAFPPKLDKVVNPIGSGDCLTAGIAAALDAGRDLVEALQYGLAAAVENVGTMLPARFEKCRVEQLAATIEIKRIS